MPLNQIKKYSDLLDVLSMSEHVRTESLRKIFNRDIQDNPNFSFRNKPIRPLKKEGAPAMDDLFHHLTGKSIIKDENGNILTDEPKNKRCFKSRQFDPHRSQRLHWIKHHTEEMTPENITIFSVMEYGNTRKLEKRTYIFDESHKYVVILAHQKSEMDYYLVSAHYLDEDWGVDNIKKKMKKQI